MSFIRLQTVSVLYTTWLPSFLVPFSMYATVRGKTRATATLPSCIYLYMSREIKPRSITTFSTGRRGPDTCHSRVWVGQESF